MTVHPMGLLRRSASLLSLWASAFQGRRNLYEVFNYTIDPTFDNRFFKYLRQDVAARVVDAPAAALWTNPPQVSSTTEGWDTAWDDLVARHNLFTVIERADKLAGIGRYAIIVIGFNDGRELDQPVNTRALKQKQGDRVLYLQPYSERSATIVAYNNDSMDDEFMKPEMYEIQPMNEYIMGFGSASNARSKVIPPAGAKGPEKNGSLRTAFRVHASRVVHIAENCLENEVYGSPRMERVYNILDDILKVTGGSAETFWLTANRGLHIDIDKDMELAPSDETALSDEMEEYQNELRRVIRTRGVKINALGSETPDPQGTFKVLISILSGSTGIPQRILIGAEAGSLASEQDRANWADRVDERRANYGNPVILFQLIKKLSRAAYLPVQENTAITVLWPSAFKMSPLEAAQTSAQHARSATNFAKTFETMEKLKRGEPGSEGKVDPVTGNPIPGTEKPAVPGVDLGELVTIEEARKFIGLDKPEVAFDSGSDVVNTQRRRGFSRHNVIVPLSFIMRIP